MTPGRPERTLTTFVAITRSRRRSQVVILANSITLDDHVAADRTADVQYQAVIDAAMCG